MKRSKPEQCSRHRWIHGIAAASLLFTLQCGKKMDHEDPEKLRRHAEGMAKVAKMAREFRENVRSENEGEQPEPYPLENVLPDPLPGWSVITTARDTSDPIPPSGTGGPRVSRIYRSGKKEVSFKIIDTHRHPVSLPDWTTEEERSTNKSRSGDALGEYKEWPLFEELKPDKEEGTIEVFYDSRFHLKLHGKGITSLKTLHTYLHLASLDLLS